MTMAKYRKFRFILPSMAVFGHHHISVIHFNPKLARENAISAVIKICNDLVAKGADPKTVWRAEQWAQEEIMTQLPEELAVPF